MTMLSPGVTKLLDVTRIAGTTMAEILLGLEPLLEPFVHAIPNHRRVADERLVIQQLEDLFVGHAALSP